MPLRQSWGDSHKYCGSVVVFVVEPRWCSHNRVTRSFNENFLAVNYMAHLAISCFLNFCGSVFLTTSMLGLYIKHFSSLAKSLTKVLKITDTVLQAMPNLWARSALVEAKRSFLSVRNSSFCEIARFGPNFVGNLLKFLPFIVVFLRPLQYFTFLTDPLAMSNNLLKAGFEGTPVSKCTV